MLAPQLRFYGAGDIPIYATAEVFDPAHTARDNDLNGFIFADTPALLAPDADRSRPARGCADVLAAAQRAELRFYGMGFDAYGLVAPLYDDDGAAVAACAACRAICRSTTQGRDPARAAARAVSQRPSRRAYDIGAVSAIDSHGLIGTR